MKHTLIALSILAVTSCNQQSTSKGYGTGLDTTRTIVLYTHSPVENAYKVASAVRVSYDTIMPDPKDKTKNIPTRDTFYNIRITEPRTDSMGAVIKRANGLDSMRDEWIQYSKLGIVYDYQFNFLPLYQAQVERIRSGK